MWNSLNAVASKVKTTVKSVAAEALETAQELSSIQSVRGWAIFVREQCAIVILALSAETVLLTQRKGWSGILDNLLLNSWQRF